MTPSEARMVDAIEATAFREFYAAAPAPLASAIGLRTLEIGGATCLLAKAIPDTFFNRVIGLGVHREAAQRDLGAVIAAYREAGIAKWQIHVSPVAEPAALPGWLGQHSFVMPPRRAWAKMIRGTDPPPAIATAAEVRRALWEEVPAMGEAIAASFGMPPSFAAWFSGAAARPGWQAYVALEDGRIIGGALLFLDGDVAWLGAGGVIAEARRRHAHRALMARRIEDAIAAGATHIATETGEPIGEEPNPSLANMYACGFRKACSRLNYAANFEPEQGR